MKGFGSALRIAVREARRHRWRSLLVVLLVALPVMATGAAAALLTSASIRDQDAVDRYMGAAQARIDAVGAPILQGTFPFRDYYEGGGEWVESGDGDGDGEWISSVPPTEADLREILGENFRLLPITLGDPDRYAGVGVRTGDQSLDVQLRALDLADPFTRGLGEVIEGREPAAAGEVAVNQELAGHGFGVGDEITTRLADEPQTVVGVIEDADLVARPVLWAHPSADALRIEEPRSWLVGPVDGADPESAQVQQRLVEELNDAGFVVASRYVAEDPSAFDVYAHDDGLFGVSSDEDLAVLVLIVTMVVIEIALLAGPAFAVTARQQARTVALMSVNGATPAQARRVVLAAAVVLGGGGALLGALLGPALAVALRPFVQQFDQRRHGGFDIPWELVLATAAVGLVSALIAAVVPAWLASRQDPVAVMNGRRSDKVSSQATRNSAVLGSLVLVAGVVLMVVSINATGAGAILLMTLAVVVTTLGMVVLAPAAVALVATVFGASSFVARYTSRDAVRHRSRTVPAVAAVAATVAGVIAVGTVFMTELSGDQGPLSADGGVQISVDVSPWDETVRAENEATYGEIVEAVEGVGVGVVRVRGLAALDLSVDGAWWLLPTEARDTADPWTASPHRAEGNYGNEALVVEPGAEMLSKGLTEEGAALARTALAEGKAVELVTELDREPREHELRFMDMGDANQQLTVARRVPVDVVQVEVFGAEGPVSAGVLLPEQWVAEQGLSTSTDWLDAYGISGEDQLEEIRALVHDIEPRSTVGPDYGSDLDMLLAVLVLGLLGVLLMVIGTLSATLLALHDADADLGTLSAVGAAPSTRRWIARGYALLVSGVGAVLGVPVGLVVGIAAAAQDYAATSVVLPWALIGLLLVVVPVFTSLVVGWTTRARMPVARRAL